MKFKMFFYLNLIMMITSLSNLKAASAAGEAFDSDPAVISAQIMAGKTEEDRKLIASNILFEAAIRGDEPVVRGLIELRNAYVRSAAAPTAARLEGAGAYIEIDARGPKKPGLFGSNHPTALVVAAENGHVGVSRLLIDAGANIKVVYPYDRDTLLGHCARQAPLPVVNLLLSNGAPLVWSHDYGGQALFHCMYGREGGLQRNLDVTRRLLQAGADPVAGTHTLFEQSVQVVASNGGECPPVEARIALLLAAGVLVDTPIS